MGLIKAAVSGIGSTLGDQWLEYYNCEAMDEKVVIKKAVKIVNGGSNTDGSPDVISQGSIISVNEGQAMMIVQDGMILEFSAEPGVFEFDNEAEPSIFVGSFGEGIIQTFKTFARRFKFGGDAGRNTRIYYFNLKELFGNKFGTPTPIPYADPVYQNINIRFNGTLSLKLADPILFYKSIAGNVSDEFEINELWSEQLFYEFNMNLNQGLAKIAAAGTKFNQIMASTNELVNSLNEVLYSTWGQKRGLKIETIAIGSVTLDPADKEKVDKYDDMRLMADPMNAAGRMTSAAANAMENAAANENGAMMGFAGFNMAAGAATTNAAQFQQMAQANQQEKQNSVETGWTCTCGMINTGKFCTECGKQNEEAWMCTCGTNNTGKFCTECGKQNENVINQWSCECGTQNTGKFCTECGQPQK
ncbi:MAG: SPFH domain-containing protein [Mycoplasmatales bacterium]